MWSIGMRCQCVNLYEKLQNNKRLRRYTYGGYWRKLFAAVFRYLLIICILFIIMYPFFSYISNSFKSLEDLTDISVNFIPKHFSLEVFEVAIKAMGFYEAFLHSLILSTFVAVLQVISSAVIGYGFGRFRFPGRGIFYALVIITLLVPPQTIMIPEYFKFRFFDIGGIIEALTGKSLNLINTLYPFGILALTGFGLKNGLYIFLMNQTFAKMPTELEEAAMVDGAGTFRIFYRIMVPNAIPMMVTVFLFSFCWQWTDTHFSSLFLSDWKVLPAAAGTIGTYQVNIIEPVVRSAASNAATLLIIVPLILIFIFAQKFFIQGIEQSGMAN